MKATRETPTRREGADTTSLLSTLALIAALSVTSACASKDTRFGLEDDAASESSTADGAAYVVDAIQFRKTMKIRPKNDYRFYYKDCSLTDPRTYYSKTSYWCTEGP